MQNGCKQCRLAVGAAPERIASEVIVVRNNSIARRPCPREDHDAPRDLGGDVVGQRAREECNLIEDDLWGGLLSNSNERGYQLQNAPWRPNFQSDLGYSNERSVALPTYEALIGEVKRM